MVQLSHGGTGADSSPAHLEGPCKLHGNQLEKQNSPQGGLEHSLRIPGSSAVCDLSQLNFHSKPWAQFCT